MRNFLRYAICIIFFVSMFACATAYDKHGVYHKVRDGESIQKIAKYYHVPVQDLAEWNNIQTSDDLYPGLKLYVPKVGTSKSAKEALSTAKDDDIHLEKSKFAWPIKGKILSNFGIRNGHRHDGLDIKGQKGDPIVAAAKGTVVYNGRLHGYGNMLILKHDDKYFTVYAHNSKNLVKKGEKVSKGQKIALIGATGRATGPHLHFEVREGEKARNPVFFLPAERNDNIEVAEKSVKGKRSTVNGEEVKGSKVKLSKRQEMMEKLKAKRK